MSAPLIVPPLFVWTARDCSYAGQIAFLLGLRQQSACGESVLESSIDLQARAPRLTDAHRFFHAAALLKGNAFATVARDFGRRIARHISGLHVVDMCHVECGASAGLGLFIDGHESPMVLEFKTPDNRTALELTDADYPKPAVESVTDAYTRDVERSAIIAEGAA